MYYFIGNFFLTRSVLLFPYTSQKIANRPRNTHSCCNSKSKKNDCGKGQKQVEDTGKGAEALHAVRHGKEKEAPDDKAVVAFGGDQIEAL